MRDKDEDKIIIKITKVLLDAKEKLLNEGFEKLGFDAAYFDVNINLKVTVDDKTIKVHEKWKRLVP